MNYREASDEVINKRVAEILKITTFGDYNGTLLVSNGRYLKPFSPINNWRDTGMVVEKLREWGDLTIRLNDGGVLHD